MLSTRRAVAAGVGAYVGITVAALGVGIELGIEPALFSSNGHALYSPYGLARPCRRCWLPTRSARRSWRA
jgi:ABC-type Co2+ transport system permease subunit